MTTGLSENINVIIFSLAHSFANFDIHSPIQAKIERDKLINTTITLIHDGFPILKTLIHSVVNTQKIETRNILKLFIINGIDIDTRLDSEKTIIMKEKDCTKMSLLLVSGANVNHVDNHKTTVLMHNARHAQYINILKLLIIMGTNTTTISKHDEPAPPLVYAMKRSELDNVVKLLINTASTQDLQKLNIHDNWEYNIKYIIMLMDKGVHIDNISPETSWAYIRHLNEKHQKQIDKMQYHIGMGGVAIEELTNEFPNVPRYELFKGAKW